MPTTQAPRRIAFVPLDHLDRAFHASITEARGRATLVVADLADKVHDVRADRNLSQVGRDAKAQDLLLKTAKVLKNETFFAPRAVPDGRRRAAFGELQGLLWSGVDKPDRVERTQARLFALAQQAPALPGKVARDTTGRTVLAGHPTLDLLASILSSAPLDDARHLAFSILRADPISLHLIGGRGTADAAFDVVRRRVVAEDRKAAELNAAMDAADQALAAINADLLSATFSADEAAGFSTGTARRLMAGDPVRDLAERRAS
jgi:hypothetical protein